MTQFKVGDRVRILDSNSSPMKVGDEGVVESVWRDDGGVDVRADVKTTPDFSWSFDLDQVAPVTGTATDASKLREAVEKIVEQRHSGAGCNPELIIADLREALAREAGR